MDRITIRLGYIDAKHSQKVKHLSAEMFHALTRSVLVGNLSSQIVAEPDQEKKNLLKQQLPAAMFACMMPDDEVRPKNENAVASGLCIHDYDHLPVDVCNLYMQKIAGSEASLGIMLAHVTPRGEGLRLVTTMNAGESIPECQERMARLLNLSQYADRGVKDLVRLSFIPVESNVLYCNDQMFEMDAPEPIVATVPVEPATIVETSPAKAADAPQMLLADAFKYEGVKFSRIITELLSRIATDGHPKAGERNTDLFALVLHLRFLTDFNFEQTRMLVAPYFTDLPDAEIRRTINSAINANGRTMTPTMRGILSQLKMEQTGIEDNHRMELQKMPKMPPVIQMMMNHYPKHVRNLVPFVCLPIFGAYGTHIRFRYLDNRLNSLSFMTAVVGKSGRGKAFATHIFENLMKPFTEWDVEERKKAQDYQQKVNRRKPDEEYPDDPHAKIRLFSDDTTTSQMLEYLDNLGGEHGFQFTEEANRLVKARKARYSDNDDLYCKAFDNGVGGKESKNSLTRNIRIPIFLNTLFCGTYNSMHSLYNNPEGGLNNRIIFAALPEIRTKGVPRYEDYSEEEWRMIEQMLWMLWQAGTMEQEDGLNVSDLRMVHQGQKEFQFPFLDKAINRWIDKCDKEDDENPDETWRDLANRAAVIGYRAGALFWFLWGMPQDEKTLRLIAREAVWVAESTRTLCYNFCGEEYDKINSKENEQPKGRMTKNKKLLSVLPEEFTIQDVVNIRRQNGDSPDVYMVLSRWMADGLVFKTAEGLYSKVKKVAN